MLKLTVVFPFGLNDWLGDDFKKEGTHVSIGSKCPVLPSKSY